MVVVKKPEPIKKKVIGNLKGKDKKVEDEARSWPETEDNEVSFPEDEESDTDEFEAENDF